MIVGIVAANNIRYSPYIFFYTNILDKMGVDYELIFPNRMNVEDTFPAKTHIVPWDKSVHTALAYLDFTGRAKKIIKQNIIVRIGFQPFFKNSSTFDRIIVSAHESICANSINLFFGFSQIVVKQLINRDAEITR